MLRCLVNCRRSMCRRRRYVFACLARSLLSDAVGSDCSVSELANLICRRHRYATCFSWSLLVSLVLKRLVASVRTSAAILSWLAQKTWRRCHEDGHYHQSVTCQALVRFTTCSLTFALVYAGFCAAGVAATAGRLGAAADAAGGARARHDGADINGAAGARAPVAALERLHPAAGCWGGSNESRLRLGSRA